MTRYGGTKAVVLGGTTGVGLAIAKRLVEGGAQVLVTGHTARDCAEAAPEVGSAAHVVGCDPADPADVRALARAVRDGFGPYGHLFATTASPETVRALVPALEDGGSVVLTGAADGAVHTLARDLCQRGIRVNVVAPRGSWAALAPEIARAALFLATEATCTTGATLPVAPTTPEWEDATMSHTPHTSPLLRPGRLGPHGLDLPNRLVMAPLTRNRAADDGTPGPLMAAYYAQRATAGLIVAEATTPNAVGQTYPGIPALHTRRHVAGWRRVTDAVREAGGRMFVQLQHGGRIGHPETSGLTPLAPSAVPLGETIHTPGGPRPSVVPREMTEADIRTTVADFARAARNAIDAGFEGVEVHGANGQLLHQFLAQNTNRRKDGYGGTVERRIRLVVEVVEAVAAEIGPERVGLRIAPGFTGSGIEEGDTERIYPALLAALAEKGLADSLAYLHIVFADPEQPLFHALRAAWPGTLIANPKLPWPDPHPADGGRGAGERLLDAGADLVSLGRAFLANPDLVARLGQDAPLNAQRPEHWYGGDATGYTDYPTLAESLALATP